MIYVVDHVLQTVEPKAIVEATRSGRLVIGYLTLNQFLPIAGELGISQSAIELLHKPTVHFRSSNYVSDRYILGNFQLVDVKHIMDSTGKIAVLLATTCCLVISVGEVNPFVEHVFETALKRCKAEDLAIEKVLYLFFDCLLMDDNVALEDIEFEFDLLEDRIVAKKVEEDFYKILIAKKRELFVLHNYYEQFIEFADMLEENEFGAFKDRDRKYLKMMNNKFDRLKQNTLMLRENLVQLREAYQAYLDYSLNNIMKLFTVVTTVFLPLTLIVGWYGMNFTTMPELTWKYGYLYVILLAAIVILLCIWLFKKKKLM